MLLRIRAGDLLLSLVQELGPQQHCPSQKGLLNSCLGVSRRLGRTDVKSCLWEALALMLAQPEGVQLLASAEIQAQEASLM